MLGGYSYQINPSRAIFSRFASIPGFHATGIHLGPLRSFVQTSDLILETFDPFLCLGQVLLGLLEFLYERLILLRESLILLRESLKL
jgi:hypothetical protein